MAKLTIVIGALLCVLGVATYGFAFQLGADKRSVTALIPAFVGALLLILGYFTIFKPDLRMHLMHASVTLTLLGFLAAAGRLIMVAFAAPKPHAAGSPPPPAISVGILANGIMAALCLAHVVLSVRSFISARRSRESGASSATPGGAA